MVMWFLKLQPKEYLWLLLHYAYVECLVTLFQALAIFSVNFKRKSTFSNLK